MTTLRSSLSGLPFSGGPALLAALLLGLVAAAPGPACSTPSVSPAAALSMPDVVEAAAGRAYLHSYNLPAHGVAIQGFSPVSYFEGRAERGDPLFAVEHEGVTYHLTSAGQVARFERDPARFVPAFGGWCAFGMSISDKFPVDPTRFEVVDGRLLLFLANDGIDARELWRGGDERELMRKAAAHWKKVQG